MSDLLP